MQETSRKFVFDPADPSIKSDINAMILQYLQEERLFNTASILQDEALIKVSDMMAKRFEGNS
jgi:hypothetical protein